MTFPPETRTPIKRAALEAVIKILDLMEPLTDMGRVVVLRTVWEVLRLPPKPPDVEPTQPRERC